MYLDNPIVQRKIFSYLDDLKACGVSGLRIDAAKHIGIDNIRTYKLHSLAVESAEMDAAYEAGKQICPDFRLEILVHME